MRVDIWSDVICPWCYVGKARSEKALTAFSHSGEVEVIHHSFEPGPDSPRGMSESNLAMLSKKFGKPQTEALAMDDHAGTGLDADEVGKVFDSGSYADEVRQDEPQAWQHEPQARQHEPQARQHEPQARQDGISGIPFFVFDMAPGASGAQPTELFARALDQAWECRV